MVPRDLSVLRSCAHVLIEPFFRLTCALARARGSSPAPHGILLRHMRACTNSKLPALYHVVLPTASDDLKFKQTAKQEVHVHERPASALPGSPG
jgi:hypothetical protein